MKQTLSSLYSCSSPLLKLHRGMLSLTFVALIFLTGCASTEVTSRQRLVYDKLPRPGQIWVFDFASSPADVPAESDFLGRIYAPPTAPTGEEIALGRQLGRGVAAQLIESIREMGLPAANGGPGISLQQNDIIIRGYLISIDQGSAGQRMVIGFGAGGSELSTAVEGFQVTPQGLRRLGSATAIAEGNKTPGAGLGAASWAVTGSPVGLIVGGGLKVYGEVSGSAGVEGRAKQTAKEIAAQLKTRFQEEGWIP